MPSANNFLSEFHPDSEFLDRNTLIGQVYWRIMRIGLTPNKAERHHHTLHIIANVMESLTPACQTCGTSIKSPICDSCRRRNDGILHLNFPTL